MYTCRVSVGRDCADCTQKLEHSARLVRSGPKVSSHKGLSDHSGQLLELQGIWHLYRVADEDTFYPKNTDDDRFPSCLSQQKKGCEMKF